MKLLDLSSPRPLRNRARAIGLWVLLATSACDLDIGRSDTPSRGARDEPETATPTASPEFVAKHEEWKQQRLETLRSPDGWLSVVGLHWLSPGSHRIGTAEDNDIVLPDAPSLQDQPPTVATLVVGTGDQPSIQIEALNGAELALAGRKIQRSELLTDAETNPSVIEIGSLDLHVIQRGGELALRVRDEASPRPTRLQEIPTWPAREDMVFTGVLEPLGNGAAVTLENVAGQIYDHPTVGNVVVELFGKTYELAAVGASPEAPLLIILADATNGNETYSGGRYLSAEVAGDGTVELDFNRLYNPPCVFTAFATCPLPPASNRIEAPIEAGEQLTEVPAAPAA